MPPACVKSVSARQPSLGHNCSLRHRVKQLVEKATSTGGFMAYTLAQVTHLGKAVRDTAAEQLRVGCQVIVHSVSGGQRYRDGEGRTQCNAAPLA